MNAVLRYGIKDTHWPWLHDAMSTTEMISTDAEKNSAPVPVANTSADSSLLHQIANLQKELATRSDEFKSLQESLSSKDSEIKALLEKHEVEMKEATTLQREQMQADFDKFIKEWISSLDLKNQEVLQNMQTGLAGMIDKGQMKNTMWEVFCTASQKHATNVNRINSLVQENEELKKLVQNQMGFHDEEARLGKRTRTNDPMAGAVPAPTAAAAPAAPAAAPASAPATTDVWGQFEELMRAGQVVNY